MEELLTIEQELNEIQEEGKQKVLGYQAEIKAAEDNVDDASARVLKVKQGDDPKAYAQAVADKRTASDIIGFYVGKIKALKDEPFITEAEYKSYSKRIKSEMDNINRRASKRAIELLVELEAIQSELTPAYVKANQLLSNLQNNIYKHSAEKQMKEARETGKSLNVNELNNEYKDDAIRSGIDYILNSHATKNIKAEGNS